MHAFADTTWWIGWAAEGLVKSTVILAAVWVLTAVGLRHASAAVRHWLWGGALVGLLLVPQLGTWLPAFEVPLLSRSMSHLQAVVAEPPARSPVLRATPAPVADEANPEPVAEASAGVAEGAVPASGSQPWILFCIYVWFLGASVLVLRCLAGLMRIGGLTRQARQLTNEADVADARAWVQYAGLHRRVTVLLSPAVEMPLTWGIVRPVILLPVESTDWDRAQLRAVMLHELAHIRRWDYPLFLLSQLAHAVYWFNPLAWLALHNLLLEQEQACDDLVLNAGTTSHEYATYLLAMARSGQLGWTEGATMAMAQRSALKRRIDAILKPISDRRPLRPLLGLGGGLLITALIVPVAMVEGPGTRESALQRLIATMERGPVLERLYAAQQLGAERAPEAIPSLIDALADPDDAVSVSAALALRQFDDPRAMQALAQMPPQSARTVSTHPGPQQPAFVWLEAERSDDPDAVRRGRSVQASGGAYIGTAGADGAAAESAYSFYVEEEGWYALWARARTTETAPGAFSAVVDDGPELVSAARAASGNRWVWSPLGPKATADSSTAAPVLHLRRGWHRMRISLQAPGTRLDRLVLTDDLGYEPVGHGAVTRPARPASIWLEAEDGLLAEPLRVVHDDASAGCQYIEVAPAHNSLDAPPSDGHAVYRFTVLDAGTYVLWGRIIAPDGRDNSFWVRLDGDEWIPWNRIHLGQAWQWVPVHHQEESGQPVHFSLNSGQHTLEVAYREGGTKLDRILITNDPSYHPDGKGAPAKPVEVIFRTD